MIMHMRLRRKFVCSTWQIGLNSKIETAIKYTKSVQYYCGIHLMLNIPSYYCVHTNVDLLGVWLCGDLITTYRIFLPGLTFYYTNTTVSSLAAGRPRDIFPQVIIPSLLGWAEVPYYKYLHIYVVYCLFLLFILCNCPDQIVSPWRRKKNNQFHMVWNCWKKKKSVKIWKMKIKNQR